MEQQQHALYWHSNSVRPSSAQKGIQLSTISGVWQDHNNTTPYELLYCLLYYYCCRCTGIRLDSAIKVQATILSRHVMRDPVEALVPQPSPHLTCFVFTFGSVVLPNPPAVASNCEGFKVRSGFPRWQGINDCQSVEYLQITNCKL